MTEVGGSRTDETDRDSMADVSHTNPQTGETFGTVYRRGPAVTDGSGEDSGAGERMRDVDHAPPDAEDAGGANDVWRRGPSADANADADADADVGAEKR